MVLRIYDKYNPPYYGFHRSPQRVMCLECHLLSIVRPKNIKMDQKTWDTGKKTTKLPLNKNDQ